MTNRLPGGPTAHVDTFAADNLPPKGQWPEFDFDSLPILRSYPDRMNAGVELLDHMCDTGFGGKPVLHYEEITWTYNDLRKLADHVAKVLVENHGLVPGNRVLLRSANNPMLVACWFAVLKAGGICVTTMQLLRARELAYIVEKAEIRHALCDIALAAEMEETSKRKPELMDTLYFSATGGNEASLDQEVASKSGKFDNCDTAADDTALIAFTSGTTGSPKATMHFHRDIMAMTDCFPRSFQMAEPHDIIAGTPPLAFTFGLGGLTCFPMRFGASTRFFPGPLGPEDMMAAIEKYKITGLYTAPTMYRQLADLAEQYDISSLQKCVSAGETLPRATWEAFFNATGIRIVDGLGSTEMIHIFIAASREEMRPGFTGKAIPGYRAKIVDKDGNNLPPNTPGFLAVQGPTGCRYLDDARQNIYVKNGWNYPGDVYEMDDNGYFKYVSRADDMIISAGYNISGPEVENALLDHEAVAECAVIGKPDEKRTNIVKAFVVLRKSFLPNDETAKTLQDYVKNEIAPYKYPREIEFVGELPKTETGKLQRFRLREKEKARG
ncbi:MAG: AMP-binding protein [Pseudomonadota bacterium]|nr:AMP-binding protein [Pseudomonadota bacterium]